MSTKNKPEPGTYAAEFIARLDRLESDAALMGMSVSDIYKEAGVGVYTIMRWRGRIPQTIQIMSDMEAVVEKRLKDAREQGRLPVNE